YTPSSGIWQTVWLENRPTTYIADFRIITSIEPAQLKLNVNLAVLDQGTYQVVLTSADPSVKGVSQTFVAPKPAASGVGSGRWTHSIDLESNVENPKLWSPETPNLYDVTIELKDAAGKPVDSIQTYFGLRTIRRGHYGDKPYERILLNGKPVYLRAALDQSFNPKGL